MSDHVTFSTIDWIIVFAYLAGSVVIGLLVKRYIASMTDYVVAGRALKTYLGLATMIGTEMGLVTVMYSAQKGFTGGFAAFHIAVVAAIVTLVVGLTGFIVVPLRRLEVMTIPEFYEKRFSRGVRVFGGIVLAFAGILNMGMFLKAGSWFVTGITGLESVTYLNIVMTVLLALVLFYTILGGMVSVVVTDYIQFVVLAVGIFVASAMALSTLGWDNIVNTVHELKGEAGFNPFHEEGFGAGYVVWMIFLGLVSCAIWQTAVLRACSAESVKVVKRIYIWSSVGFLIRFLVPYFWGICAFVFLYQHPDLKAVFFPETGKISSELSLQAMPVFLSIILPAGLLGLVTAAMLAAFMSTHDSYLLCWSSVLTQDVLAPILGDRMTTKARIVWTRIFIFLIGVFLLVWGLWYAMQQDLWDYMAITGAIYSTGAFAVLLAGLYWKRASTVGAYGALVCGFVALLGLKPLQTWLIIHLNLESLVAGLGFQDTVGSEWVGLFTIALAVTVMFVGSLLFPDRRKEAA
ncbi:MAG: sodium:solute symporter family protein [Phycisphaerae bacterium]|nr:sodium:solute symporter family protein [Phycisphaerae bacterium]